MEMNAQAPKLEDAENDLKQLMADVTRAMEKARVAHAIHPVRVLSQPAARGLRPRRRLPHRHHRRWDLAAASCCL